MPTTCPHCSRSFPGDKLNLWESEVKTRPDDVRERLAAHLAGA